MASEGLLLVVFTKRARSAHIVQQHYPVVFARLQQVWDVCKINRFEIYCRGKNPVRVSPLTLY